MKLHHVGMLVSSMDAGRAMIEKFYRANPMTPAVDDPLQDATVQLFDGGGVTLELIAPLSEASHLRNVLARTGEHLAHLCYETASLDEAIADFRRNGALLVSRKPAKLFDGREVAFLFLPNRMIIELLAAT
jgi:hypothetical protein